MILKLTGFAALFVLANLSIADTAHAYLDPGTGSMVLQLLVAGVLGALFTIKMYWKRTKAFVASFFKRSSQDQ